MVRQRPLGWFGALVILRYRGIPPLRTERARMGHPPTFSFDKIKTKGKGKNKNQEQIKVKGSGQECPLHTSCLFWH